MEGQFEMINAFPEFCRSCGAIANCEIKFDSIVRWLLAAAGYQSYCCEKCGFRWNQFSLFQILWSLTYLFIPMGIGFVLWDFIR